MKMLFSHWFTLYTEHVYVLCAANSGFHVALLFPIYYINFGE